MYPLGGNGYPDAPDALERTVLPDRELFIRWVQLSAYLPSMQFSIAPWQYDTEVVDISREMVRIHETQVAPLVLAAAREATVTGGFVVETRALNLLPSYVLSQIFYNVQISLTPMTSLQLHPGFTYFGHQCRIDTSWYLPGLGSV